MGKRLSKACTNGKCICTCRTERVYIALRMIIVGDEDQAHNELYSTILPAVLNELGTW